MRRVKAEKEEIPIFLVIKCDGERVEFACWRYCSDIQRKSRKKIRWQIINDGTNTDFAIVFASCLVPFWIA